MAQDWFSENAPKASAASGADWFSANALGSGPNLTNAKGEGTYRMVAPGTHWNAPKSTGVDVPYSAVEDAQKFGYQFQSPGEGDRWHKDYGASLSTMDKLRAGYHDLVKPVPSDGSQSEGGRFGAFMHNFAGEAAHAAKATLDVLKPDAPRGFDLVPGHTAVRTADGGIELKPNGPSLVQRLREDPALAIAQEAGGLAGGAAVGEVIGGALKGAGAGARAVVRAGRGSADDLAARAVSAVQPDTALLRGDTVTAQQAYDIARKQGVQPDLAQATQTDLPRMAKRSSEFTNRGARHFEELQRSNEQALQDYTTNFLDSTAPQMERETFGNAVRDGLLQQHGAMKEAAASAFNSLSDDVGTSQPSMRNAQAAAKDILDSNGDYYSKHPEMMDRATKRAWGIVQKIAKGTTDTWADAHRLREDLMNIYRGPELVNPRASAWLQRLAGEVDGAMTGAESGLNPDQVQRFRDANATWKVMKDRFDTPQSPFYSLTRQPDGLSVANSVAQLTPESMRYLKTSLPDLTAQIQRQQMERMLSPKDNELPEWSTYGNRYKNFDKAKLQGTLSPDQMREMEEIARTSRMIQANANPSGTARTQVPTSEFRATLSGLGDIVAGANPFKPEPGRVATGAAKVASPFVSGRVARTITDPAVVDRVMRGPAAWVARGAQNLIAAGAAPEAVEAMASTRSGKQALIHASELRPESPAMANLVQQAHQRASAGAVPAPKVSPAAAYHPEEHAYRFNPPQEPQQ